MACMEKWMVFINRGAGNLPRVSPSNNLLYLTTKKITCQIFTVLRAWKEILAQHKKYIEQLQSCSKKQH
jgi:hypothetical protein